MKEKETIKLYVQPARPGSEEGSARFSESLKEIFIYEMSTTMSPCGLFGPRAPAEPNAESSRKHSKLKNSQYQALNQCEAHDGLS